MLDILLKSLKTKIKAQILSILQIVDKMNFIDKSGEYENEEFSY